MADDLTLVSIAWRKRRRNHRLLFGTPYRWVRLDWRRRCAAFKPGQIFAYERWRANKYGTQSWQVFVVKTISTTGSGQRIAGVMPGGELLLSAHGAAASKRVLKTFDQLSDVCPIDSISENRWRQIACLQSTGLSHLAAISLMERS